MRLRLDIFFRAFNSHEERQDSGYFDGISRNHHASIHVNTNDDVFEQFLTIFHELFHALVAFMHQYKFSKGRYIRQPSKVFATWSKKHSRLEERVCRQVERAVGRIFKKRMPISVTRPLMRSKRVKG